MAKQWMNYYMHSDKSDNTCQFEEQGIDYDTPASENLRYAFYEVEFKLLVDTETGQR